MHLNNGIANTARLMDFLIEGSREHGRELYPMLIRIFLYIAEKNLAGESPIQQDIINDLGIIQTSVYRAISALGKGTAKKPDSGMGFIEVTDGTDDWRKKPIVLTPKGRAFLEELTQIIEKRGAV